MIKQNMAFRHVLPVILCLLLPLSLTFGASARTLAQEGDDYRAERERAFDLWHKSNFSEATPLLEKLAKANPSDVEVLSLLGFSLYATTATMTDPAARQKTRARALEMLVRARELGDNSTLSQMTIDLLSSEDATDIPFSNLKEAEAAMREGEAAFVKGEMDKALTHYERALQLDPKLYEAALYAGDMYFKKGMTNTDARGKKEQLDKAGEWFARAVGIDQNRETAYRYWGDVMMGQDRMDEARAKFVEAFIAEPYNKLARTGLIQWAERNNVTLAHIKIDIPSSVSSPEKGGAKVTLDPSMLNDKQDGSAAWLMYALTRVTWMDGKEGKVSEKFAKQYPDEKTYRHSLAEEASALSMAIAALKEMMKDKKVKQLNPSLANLLKLSDAGLIEAYVLLARPDEGIAQDFAAYRKSNHDKLRRYVVEIILTGGGK